MRPSLWRILGCPSNIPHEHSPPFSNSQFASAAPVSSEPSGSRSTSTRARSESKLLTPAVLNGPVRHTLCILLRHVGPLRKMSFGRGQDCQNRSEEHTSELQSLR